MRERLYEILARKNEFLLDDEILIYIKGNELIALRNDGEALIETHGDVPKEADSFLNWLEED